MTCLVTVKQGETLPSIEHENFTYQKPLPVIVCAANKVGDHIIVGIRHFCPIMRANYNALGIDTKERGIQGFVDQFGTFYDRIEALQVAKKAGQINTRRPKTDPKHLLFSEDLY